MPTTKHAHYTRLGVSMQPTEADADGYLEYREGYEDLAEDEWTPAERWLAEQERRIAEWRARG